MKYKHTPSILVGLLREEEVGANTEHYANYVAEPDQKLDRSESRSAGHLKLIKFY